MTTARNASLTFLALLLTGLLAMPATVARAGDHEHDHGNPIHEAMEEINKAFKQIRRQKDDASKNADSAALTATMIEQAKAIVDAVPALAAEQPEDQRAAYIEGYQKLMTAMIAECETMKTAFEENRNADASASYEKLKDIKAQGHDKYTDE